MTDKLFLDTNVVLDLLGEREPFYDSVAKIATLADKGIIQLIVSAITYQQFIICFQDLKIKR
jgi:predicted nucleic acid-binding protein